MVQALNISALGMALVFIGLLLLWLMMSLLVRLTQAKSTPPDAPTPKETLDENPPIDQDIMRQAAAAAAAVSLALSRATLTISETDQQDHLSPWQAAHRPQQIAAHPARPNRKD